LALGALLAVSAVVGFLHVEVQAIRGQDQALQIAGRSELGTAFEEVLFLPDIAVNTAGLAVLAKFKGRALPVDDDQQSDLDKSLGSDGEGRIFDLSSSLPIYVFLPELLILLGAALLTALYAGYATARSAGGPNQLVSAGWGALTGIVWAIALAILRAMSFVPSTTGDSVFAGALLIGTLAGAAGGFLAFGPATRGPSPDEAVHG